MINIMPRMRAAYLSYMSRRRDTLALSAMDDMLLKDIGLTRSEIHPAVRGLVRSAN